MHNNYFERFLLTITYLLNIGVWTHHFHIAIKICYAVVVGIVTFLTCINQWNVFRKTYHTWKIVIIIDHVFTFIVPKRRKKNRHHPSIKNKYP